MACLGIIHVNRSVFIARNFVRHLCYSRNILFMTNLSYDKVWSFKHTQKITKEDFPLSGLRPFSPFQPKLLSSSSLIKCWNCGKELTTLVEFCDDCNKLQPFDISRNYFDVLGIEKSFSVDTKSLTKLFRRLQAQFHPDKFSIKTETEKQYAVDHSSEINKAYRCILNPVERALYLLDLAGQPLHEGQIDLDPEFLMEIMEVNEELAEATDKDAVASIGQKNQKILDGLLLEADAAFSSNDIQTARGIVSKIKYYNNIYWKVKEYERQHGILD